VELSDKTLTRADIVAALTRDIRISKYDAATITGQIFEEIAQSLADGDNVKISSFGSFVILDKQARMGRNPKTGKDALISARHVVSFRASNKLKQRVRSAKI
jgi:integration host factor subunit alpha